jgi:zinc transport system substrate-binding protein
MRRTIVAVALAGGLLLAACGDDGATGSDGETTVAASFYPLAFVAQEVGGDDVVVTDLTPAGAEPHDLELTPDQVDEILDADVAIVMGNGFQPAAEDTADDRDAVTVFVFDELPIDAGGRVVEDEHEDEGGEEESDEAHGDEALDPHVWLDPVLMGETVLAVTDALVEADPDHAAGYERRARALERRIERLDAEYTAGLADCERDIVVTSHDAFARLAARYGLVVEPIAGISPDEEPSPERLAELADLAEEEGVTTIFTETLVSPDVAETLAREAGGLETAVLNPLEGLTDDEVDEGADYFTVMEDNLAALEAALGCR